MVLFTTFFLFSMCCESCDQNILSVKIECITMLLFIIYIILFKLIKYFILTLLYSKHKVILLVYIKKY